LTMEEAAGLDVDVSLIRRWESHCQFMCIWTVLSYLMVKTTFDA
jgi:hypothetical protein